MKLTTDEKPPSPIPCLGHREESYLEPSDYTCDYRHGEIDCGDCIVNGGRIDPRTGKRFHRKRK